MIRCAIAAFRNIRPFSVSYKNAARIIYNAKGYSTLNISICDNLTPRGLSNGSILNNKSVLNIAQNIALLPTRSVTKFSLKKGKRKTVKAATRRFFRLHWGAWIRPKVGRKKHLWKKSAARKRRLRQHVFCNATQNTLLDKMVTKCWKRPKHYVDDPYAPYHTREEYLATKKLVKY